MCLHSTRRGFLSNHFITLHPEPPPPPLTFLLCLLCNRLRIRITDISVILPLVGVSQIHPALSTHLLFPWCFLLLPSNESFIMISVSALAGLIHSRYRWGGGAIYLNPESSQTSGEHLHSLLYHCGASLSPKPAPTLQHFRFIGAYTPQSQQLYNLSQFKAYDIRFRHSYLCPILWRKAQTILICVPFTVRYPLVCPNFPHMLFLFFI